MLKIQHEYITIGTVSEAHMWAYISATTSLSVYVCQFSY